MGKNTHTNASPNDKTNPNFKWVRMLHVLDYHRWHYVKKVLAHKKHSEARNNATVSDSNALELHPCTGKEIVDNSQIEVECTDEYCPLPSCTQAKSSPPVPPTPPTKSSRAARIRKMIAKEVTKRRGRHRRCSTCPAGSELATNDSSTHQHLEPSEEGFVAEKIKNEEIPTSGVDHGDKKCDLCSTMQIVCQLGDKKHVGEQPDQQLDHLNVLLQQIPDDEIDQFPFDKNMSRSATFQHSKEFLDAMDVLSMNKQFFLRILDDPGSSLRQHFLNNKRKSLTKSETFPASDPSSTKDYSHGLFKQKHKSYSKEKGSKNTTALHDNTPPMVGRRFKDLRQKIKHVIKESRKERRRIAMDAVLHKVPYGQKVSEETTQDSPCVSFRESENESEISSPSNSKDGNNRTRRSPSLDESLDKYQQLFETTSSFGREAKTDTPERSRLTVMDANPSRSTRKDLGRIFSSPDLQMFLNHQGEGSDGYISSRTPNRRILSFNEQKVLSVLNVVGLESRKHEESKSKDDIEEHIMELCPPNNISTRESFLESSVDYEENAMDDQSDTNVESPRSLELASCDDDSCVSDTKPTPMPIMEPVSTSMLESDLYMDLPGPEGTILEDSEQTPAQELSSESPTSADVAVDSNELETPLQAIPSDIHHLRVASKDEAEFNYVRDILQLSGYSGSQLLGTWYSSDQPVDPSVFVELESCSLLEPECSPSKEGTHSSSSSGHLLLFDLINEILLAIYERSVTYWSAPLTPCSRAHPMPMGFHVLEEVWACITWYMGCSRPEVNRSLDYITMRDLAKDDGWMNLQFDAECVGLEVEDLIFDDLLNELIS